MSIQIDLKVMELLASRLCHDLVGPVGAVNNGLELLEDDFDEMGPEALKLAAESGARAARALQYFRFAYGMAGSRVGGQLEELRELAGNYFGGEKVRLAWPTEVPAGELPGELPEDLGKLLLNLLLLGAECLPLGGELSLALEGGAETGGLSVKVLATGERAGLRDETRPALAPGVTPDELTPRNVQAFFTCKIAERMGGGLTLEDGAEGRVAFTARLGG